MDINDNQSFEGDSLLVLERISDQLDDVLDLALLDFNILIESIVLDIGNGVFDFFGPKYLRNCKHNLARPHSTPVSPHCFWIGYECLLSQVSQRVYHLRLNFKHPFLDISFLVSFIDIYLL